MNDTLKTQLRIMKMSDITPNFSELSRQYDIDRRTVKKYYDGYEGKPVHHEKSSMLDKYEDEIREKSGIEGIKMSDIYQYLVDIHGDDAGSYSNFRKYMISKGLRPEKTEKGHPRFETEPGVQAQADWKEDVKIRNRNGDLITFQVFNYKLGYSRYPVFSYRLTKTRQDVFDCLISSFKRTGGVPKEILFDNMSSVVDLNGGHRSVNQKVREFARDFNFKIKLCKPRHPYTKGKVESANKFISWLKPYECEFDTEEELIDLLYKLNRKVISRKCDETNVPPILLFQKEKEFLQSLPRDSIIESYLSHDRVSTVLGDSMITYKGNKYSVPPEYIGRPVRISVSGDRLMIYDGEDLILSRDITDKRLNYLPEHYRALLSSSVNDGDAIDKMAERNLGLMDNLL